MEPLDRFIDAQHDVYASALAELHAGSKRTHWMWFIFPQVAGLGSSPMARRFAIADLAEARAYLAHPVLGDRLIECAGAILAWAGRRDLHEILGAVDGLKFRSAMTLFEAARGGALFSRALDEFCEGDRDARTLEILLQTGQ